MQWGGAMHAGVFSLRRASLPHLGRRNLLRRLSFVLRLPWMRESGESVRVLAEGRRYSTGARTLGNAMLVHVGCPLGMGICARTWRGARSPSIAMLWGC